MKPREPAGDLCFLLDEQGRTLVRGALLDPPDAPFLRVRILEDNAREPLYRETVQVVGMEGAKNILARVTDQRRDMLALERLRRLDTDLRRNFRICTRFAAPLYPLDGPWRGRRWATAHDLSCGGIAFYCRERLAVGEEMEIAIPITVQPLVLRCKVLRAREDPPPAPPFYACEFQDLCHDEETLVRRAVFSTQLRQRRPEAR